jgi:hypoxanthine-guanine phosphoribosyltransferase
MAVISKTVPPRWRKEVQSILITDEQIARRVKTLAREIERDFRGREMVVVSLLSGTVMFLADLIRHLNLPLRLDFMGVSSWSLPRNSGWMCAAARCSWWTIFSTRAKPSAG